MTNAVLVVDNSMLASSVARCTRKALLRHWHRLAGSEESKYLKAGSAVHAALDEYWRSGGDVLRAMSELALQYSDFGSDIAKVEADDRLAWRNVKSVMQGWFEDHPLGVLPFVVESSEAPFAVWLNERVVVVGRVDGRVRDKADPTKRRLLENKTTGSIDRTWVRQFHVDSQCSEYLWAAELADGKPYDGVYVNGIELSKAPSDPQRKCRKHGVPYAECGPKHQNHQIVLVGRQESDTEGWKRDAEMLAMRYWDAVVAWPAIEQIAEVPAEGRFVGECSWCPFYDFCSVGCPQGAIGSTLVKAAPWEPAPGLEPGKWYDATSIGGAVSALAGWGES